jgi:cell division protein FtsL
MRIRGILTAFSAMLLLAGMFVAVHRGARGHGIAERISGINDRLEAADETRSELRQRIEFLNSRTRVVRAAEALGLHLPSEDELVYLDISALGSSGLGGSR